LDRQLILWASQCPDKHVPIYHILVILITIVSGADICSSVSKAGSFNGLSEGARVAFGAPYYGSNGAVFIMNTPIIGASNYVFTSPHYSSHSSGLVAEGGGACAEFGFVVAFAGGFDGDEYDDVIIGCCGIVPDSSALGQTVVDFDSKFCRKSPRFSTTNDRISNKLISVFSPCCSSSILFVLWSSKSVVFTLFTVRTQKCFTWFNPVRNRTLFII
jgi:hypothetical protein